MEPQQVPQWVNELIGINVEQARDIANNFGFAIRYVRLDNHNLTVLNDYRTDRINVQLRSYQNHPFVTDSENENNISSQAFDYINENFYNIIVEQIVGIY